MAVFSGTTPLQVVIKRTGGLVWKNWPMNHTRRANAKARHIRLAQVEAILRACSQPPPTSANAQMSKQEEMHEERSKQ
ncbi:unnamed protein product [Calypogeia fissa]